MVKPKPSEAVRRVLFYVLIAFIASMLVAGSAQAQPAKASWQPDASGTPYSFIRWTLRPDGHAAAYVIKSTRGDGAALLVHDFASDVVTELAHAPPEVQQPDFLPTWSPDGSMLAYFKLVHGAARLDVWRQSDGTVHAFMRDACASSNTSGCPWGQLEWSPDGRYVYFTAKTTDEIANPTQAGERQSEPAWRKLLYVDLEDNGITVRTTTKEKVPLSDGGAALPYGVEADVVAVDTHNGSEDTIFSCSHASLLSLAPDGKHLLVVSLTGRDGVLSQLYADIFVVPTLNGAGPRRVDAAAPGNCRRSGDQDLEPLVRRVPQVFRPPAWSPDSRTIAFVEAGARANGDVYVLDPQSGNLVDLTAEPLPKEKGEDQVRAPPNQGGFAGSGKKFDTARLVWSPSNDAIYALRKTPVGGVWRSRLWRIPLDGRPANLSAGVPYNLGLPLLVGAAPGGRRGLLVPYQRPDGLGGFLALDHHQKQPGRLYEIPGGFLDRTSSVGKVEFALAPKAILFVSEGSRAPQEAYVFQADTGQVKRVTSFNSGVDLSRLPTRRLVRWRSQTGLQRFGYLYLPPQAADPPPLIVQVYPRNASSEPSVPSETFVGDDGLFLPPLSQLLREGYAIFQPDLPVAGHGKTCDDVAFDIDLALDSIAVAKLADVARSAIVGHSFGGWTVNCVVTRTRRFRAAVSVAGISDWISMRFSPIEDAQKNSVGGGQAEIGKSVWNAPSSYWHESPVSSVRNATTPLLLLHGKLDESVPVDQSVEMYTAMEQLGKTATLVTYDGVGHGSIVDLPDYRQRVIRWIEDRLVDQPVQAQTRSTTSDARRTK